MSGKTGENGPGTPPVALGRKILPPRTGSWNTWEGRLSLSQAAKETPHFTLPAGWSRGAIWKEATNLEVEHSVRITMDVIIFFNSILVDFAVIAGESPLKVHFLEQAIFFDTCFLSVSIFAHPRQNRYYSQIN